jgi:hypothetical protein
VFVFVAVVVFCFCCFLCCCSFVAFVNVVVLLENFDFASWDIQQIVVDREQGQEGHEDAGGAEEVPEVVAIVKVEHLAIGVLKSNYFYH